ncbi:MAG: long-chain fatty acid--CoA ligase [Acidobacteria bacterium]|nr:long-chain fatty acid--CoA ligase [Acidobacteriota bacterium]
MAEPASINEALERAFAQHAAKPDLLNYKRDDQWQHVSTGEFRRMLRHLVLGLHGQGLRSGERVALLSENRIEWTLTDLAVLTLGAVTVPLYTTQAVAQVDFILRDAGARWLAVSTPSLWERCRLASSAAELEHLVTFEDFDMADHRQARLGDLLEAGRRMDTDDPNLFEHAGYWPDPEEVATLIYTSGTTGTPKGVMLTHGNLTSSMLSVGQALGINAMETVLSLLPLSHIFERASFYMSLYHGHSIYYAEPLERLGRNLLEVRPTLLVVVPRVIKKLYERILQVALSGPPWKRRLFFWAIGVGKEYARQEPVPPGPPISLRARYVLAFVLVFAKWRRGLGLERLRLMISGGAPLSVELARVFSAARIEIFQGYGLTETSPGVALNAPGANKLGTVGRPLPGVEVRISEDGEILVRGQNVTPGYYHRPEENQAAFTEDGYFRTGDLGYLDSEGYLMVTDRKKDLLKTSGGKTIAPQPIENQLKQSFYIAEALLVADRRKFVSALLVPNIAALRAWAGDHALNVHTDEELVLHPAVEALYQSEIEQCNRTLGGFECIKRFALLTADFSVDGGELTPTLKVRRRAVEERYRSIIDRLYHEGATGADGLDAVRPTRGIRDHEATN